MTPTLRSATVPTPARGAKRGLGAGRRRRLGVGGGRLRPHLNRCIVAGGLLVVLPAIAVCGRVRPSYGRRLARHAIVAIGRLCGVRFAVRGADKIEADSPYILVANHSSPLDIAALLVADEHARFLAATELFRIPLLASAMRALGTIPIDRHHPGIAYRQLDALAASDRLLQVIAFPEGGIAPVGERRPFRRGAFRLAASTGAAVIPVAVHGSDLVLPPRGALAVRPGTVTIEVLAPITSATEGHADAGQVRSVAEQRIGDALAAPSGPTG